jgi:hypothetical protein
MRQLLVELPQGGGGDTFLEGRVRPERAVLQAPVISQEQGS